MTRRYKIIDDLNFLRLKAGTFIKLDATKMALGQRERFAADLRCNRIQLAEDTEEKC